MELIMNTAAEKFDQTLLKDRGSFQSLITDKLGATPLDFADRFQAIRNTWKEHKKHLAAGVFLLLQYGRHTSAGSRDEPVFLLIKRSLEVAQSGDISCPGGMLNPFLDSLLSRIIMNRFAPFHDGNALNYARGRDVPTFRTIRLFLANAARESWEEIGLNPFNVSFLGALPTYSLHLFKRTIFPVVGLIKDPWHYKPNSEVEKIVEIPVHAFFDSENYCRCCINSDNSRLNQKRLQTCFPCMTIKQEDNTEEILWGATFNIITNFLSIVFENPLPMVSDKTRIVSKICPDNYFRGNSR